MSAVDGLPKSGKLVVAANPWLLAAVAKKQGLATDVFRESDLVPDGMVCVLDLDKILALPDDFTFEVPRYAWGNT